MKTLLYSSLLFACICLSWSLCAQSISATYSFGDIPTSYDVFDPSCNGPSATLTLTLPAGDLYPVTGIDISYTMTASGLGWMSEQISYIYSQNSYNGENMQFGVGQTTGTYSYNRTNVLIANGSYPGGTDLVFEMRAVRTFEDVPGCNTQVNRVDAGSWTITVYYGNEIKSPNVGINVVDPAATLDVDGKLKVGDDTNAPEAGMIRWNTATNDFEGFNGMNWVSLTQSKDAWGNKSVNENYATMSPITVGADYCGTSVSISDQFAIVGSPGHASFKGMATIFLKTGNAWLYVTDLFASDGAAGSYFGGAVSISRDYAIVGARNHTVGSNSNQGKAYVYHYNGSTWSQQDDLVGSGGASDDNFGNSVSISGDYAIVGAPGPFAAGKAFIFHRSDTTWTEQSPLLGIIPGDGFGYSVGISGDYAIIGAPGYDGQGHVSIYKRSGTSWSSQSSFSWASGSFDQMGFSVAISGDYAIAGVPFYDANGISDIGGVLFFERTGGAWSTGPIVTASDEIANSEFGYGVGISGNTAIIGAHHHSPSSIHLWAGKGYVFERLNGNWVEITSLNASNPHQQDQLGSSVAIFSNHVAVGAPYFKNGSPPASTGMVYIYQK